MEASAKSHLVAAERGDHDAQFELFIYFTQGVGVEADEAKATAFLERAAAGNHPRALFNVGADYATGKHGDPENKKAAEYYERADMAASAAVAGGWRARGVGSSTNRTDTSNRNHETFFGSADFHGHGPATARPRRGRARTCRAGPCRW